MSDLLKEAIADAKAVRETALANAKLALEEAFTPKLKSMLSQKIQSEIEEQDDEAPEDEEAEEAEEETLQILELYRKLAEDHLAIPVLTGLKTDAEKFAGAERTYCIEAMMGDKKALQAGTSHYLGQNFAKAFDVTFQTQENKEDHVYATSWGISTRLVGAVIMAHGDDKGLRLPPQIAPHQVVIIPIVRNKEHKKDIKDFIERKKYPCPRG